MISASQRGTCSCSAASISCAVSTWTTAVAAGGASSALVISTTSAPRSRAASATAWPIFPVERLPMKRTGSAGSRVPPAVTAMRTPARSPYSRPLRAFTWATTAAGSISRPAPTSPGSEPALDGPEELDAARAECRGVLLSRGIGPHLCIHCGRDQHGARALPAPSARRSRRRSRARSARFVEALAGTIR